MDVQFIVLESNSRIGGRTYTFQLNPTTKIELGASWIYGVGLGLGDSKRTHPKRYPGSYNPIYRIVKDNDITIITTWENEDYVKTAVYWWKGDKVGLLGRIKMRRLENALYDYVVDNSWKKGIDVSV
jgi:phytoene dehydrogenase-like protein